MQAVISVRIASGQVDPFKPIGVAHGVYKVTALSYSILGIPPESRTDHPLLSLGAVALTPDVNFFGAKKECAIFFSEPRPPPPPPNAATA